MPQNEWTKHEYRSYDPLEAPSRAQDAEPGFRSYNNTGKTVFGPSPKLHLIFEAEQPLFHEAAVFVPSASTDTLFVTSNGINDPKTGKRQLLISKLTRQGRDDTTWTREQLPSGDSVMSNGGVNWPARDSVLFCAQGDQETPSALVAMGTRPPHATERIIAHFHGRQFNSVNDVVFARDGSIWFTDPIYGYEQGFRPKPELPTQVYRYDPAKQDVRVVADGFGRPNGLCFSPDESVMYITDTDWLHGDGTHDDMRPSHIYAFDVEHRHGGPFLTNRRVFAMASHGIPDGIKCDTVGRVYSGCGDGVNVWAPDGSLVGRVLVPGGVANFCFGRPGELLLLNECRFLVASLAEDVQGDLLRSMGVEV